MAQVDCFRGVVGKRIREQEGCTNREKCEKQSESKRTRKDKQPCCVDSTVSFSLMLSTVSASSAKFSPYPQLAQRKPSCKDIPLLLFTHTYTNVLMHIYTHAHPLSVSFISEHERAPPLQQRPKERALRHIILIQQALQPRLQLPRPLLGQGCGGVGGLGREEGAGRGCNGH